MSCGKYRLLGYGAERVSFSANVVPNAPILVTLMMEAIRSSGTSFLTAVIRRHIP
jgi:hypothetical protein